MAFEEGSHSLTCPVCQAVHRADWHRIPCKEAHVLKCLVCDTVIQKGNSIRSYDPMTLGID